MDNEHKQRQYKYSLICSLYIIIVIINVIIIYIVDYHLCILSTLDTTRPVFVKHLKDTSYHAPFKDKGKKNPSRVFCNVFLS